MEILKRYSFKSQPSSLGHRVGIRLYTNILIGSGGSCRVSGDRPQRVRSRAGGRHERACAQRRNAPKELADADARADGIYDRSRRQRLRRPRGSGAPGRH